VLALLAVLLPLMAEGGAADAYPGAPWFRPGQPYTGNFPDPTVVRLGATYYAYATNTGGALLPVMTSTDLRTWTPRPAYDPGATGDPYFNDALPHTASWGVDLPGSKGRLGKQVWAPGVFRWGGRYVAFYALRARVAPRRTCIAVATSASPLGPFVDRTSRPVVCDGDEAGSIDPEPFVDPASGQPYLVWKSEGEAGRRPTRIWAQRLDARGTALLPGAPRRQLLQTAMSWEGPIIENPSMVRYGGRWWLFYSGNDWASARYAVGYARCAGPLGPCTRASRTPLLRSTATTLGPGGASAFLDAAGHLRLAHHGWNAPYTDYPAYPACIATSTCTSQGQRRLALASVHLTADGHLALG
jgi:beta-xylosidase